MLFFSWSEIKLLYFAYENIIILIVLKSQEKKKEKFSKEANL